MTVYPLEGIWQQTDGTKLIKENLEYTIMICQPDVISQEIFDLALEKIKIKKPSLLYQEITFATIEAGIAVDILHLGTFDDEPASFYLQENNLKRTGISHREIYLNNPNRVSKDKLKTILRYIVKE